MPAPLSQLRRGTVALALFPFTQGLPIEVVARRVEGELVAALGRHQSVESIEASLRPGEAPEVVARVKLRRVLLLQDGTSPRRQDVTVARIGSINEEMRSRPLYAKLVAGTHPTFWRIGDRPHHGTAGREALVNLLSVAPIGKATILRRTGCLSEAEMRDISERLVTALELDLSRLQARLHRGRERDNEVGGINSPGPL